MAEEHEFNNRIAAQRAILRVVNHGRSDEEPLLGLSSNAIDRWTSINRIDQRSRAVVLLRELSRKLFFLANRSQEQVSDDYKAIRAEVVAACDALEVEFRGIVA